MAGAYSRVGGRGTYLPPINPPEDVRVRESVGMACVSRFLCGKCVQHHGFRFVHVFNVTDSASFMCSTSQIPLLSCVPRHGFRFFHVFNVADSAAFMCSTSQIPLLTLSKNGTANEHEQTRILLCLEMAAIPIMQNEHRLPVPPK